MLLVITEEMCRTYNGYDINGLGFQKDGRGNLAEIEIHDLVISLYYLVHDEFSSFLR